MGRAGNYMGITDGILEQAGRDKTGGMGHVDPQDSANLIRDSAHAFVIPLARVSGSPADDQLRFVFEGELLHPVVVDKAGLRIEAVGDGMVQDAGSVHGRAVGKVSAAAEVESEESVARIENGHRHGHIGLGAGMGLDVRPCSAVQRFQAIDCELLDLVDYFASAIISVAWIAFGIFVSTDRAHRAEDLLTHIIFRRNKFEAAGLTFALILD